MLALLFRGTFLLGIVGWYSTNLWSMIDSYFKDQFQRYLNEEYQKNPKMRDDVHLYATVGKPEIPVANIAKQPEARAPEPCNIDTCPIGEVDSSIMSTKVESMPGIDAFGADAVKLQAEKEVVEFRESQGKNCDTKPPEEHSRKPTEIENNKKKDIQMINPDTELKPKPDTKVRKKRSKLRNSAESKNTVGNNKKQRSKVRILTLTDKDFEAVAHKKKLSDNFRESKDFAEFEDDDNQSGSENRDYEESSGFLVSELPFKPVIDIYDLDKLSREEFCPFTLDDDPTCEETKPWP